MPSIPPIHFIDFEGSLRTGVVEWGVATVEDGKVRATATGLCCPVDRMQAEDIRVHGLDDAMLAGRPPFGDEWDRFAALRDTGPFAAHHAPVENALLKAAWPFPRLCIDYSQPKPRRAATWGPWLDTLRLAQCLLPGMPEYGLGALVEHRGLSAEVERLAHRHCPPNRNRSHCALYDALASAVLFLDMARHCQAPGTPIHVWYTLSHPVGTQYAQAELF